MVRIVANVKKNAVLFSAISIPILSINTLINATSTVKGSFIMVSNKLKRIESI